MRGSRIFFGAGMKGGGCKKKCRKSEAQFGNFTKYVKLINYTYTELSSLCSRECGPIRHHLQVDPCILENVLKLVP